MYIVKDESPRMRLGRSNVTSICPKEQGFGRYYMLNCTPVATLVHERRNETHYYSI